jgi:hypothetical protein
MKRLTKERDEALKMRMLGMSYSQIKQKINVSKSTLNLWLGKYPLSKERIDELSWSNERRIERFRNTMKCKKDIEIKNTLDKVSKLIGKISHRDLLIAGLFLYWGEGDKSGNVFSISNTDPDMMRFFMFWARTFNINEDKFRVVLHLYSDMNQIKEKIYWSKILKIPIKNFRKTYIKNSTLTGLTYKKGFKHGTCMVRVYDRKLAMFVLTSLQYIKGIA